jgi:hypothetical protein
MHNEIKVGDWYVQTAAYSTYSLRKPVPSQVIEVSPTDVYLEHGHLSRGSRFEHAIFKVMFRKLTKLEQYLEGYESP